MEIKKEEEEEESLQDFSKNSKNGLLKGGREDKKNFPFYRSNLRDKPSSKRSHVNFHRRSFMGKAEKFHRWEIDFLVRRIKKKKEKKKRMAKIKGGRRQALGDLLNTAWWRWCVQTFAILYSFPLFKGRIRRIVLEGQE